jgi:hypothetical protein
MPVGKVECGDEDRIGVTSYILNTPAPGCDRAPGTRDSLLGSDRNWMLAMRCDVIRRTEGRICVAILPFIVDEAVWCVSKSSVQTMDGNLLS